mgnify:CR=1 FL=1|jgi:hypothetical protein
MHNLPERITGITHPLIKDMYVARHTEGTDKLVDVLIVETARDEVLMHDDEIWLDLLADLSDLEKAAHDQIGDFDRIDIRAH